MKKILCLFDYGPSTHTGYATVSRNIVEQLMNRFNDLKLGIVAINYFGEPFDEYDGRVKVISGKRSQGQPAPGEFANGDDFGRLTFMEVLRDGDFDGIFIINDLGAVAHLVPLLQNLQQMFAATKKGKPFKSIIYFPVDGPLQAKVENKAFDAARLKEIPKGLRDNFANLKYTRQIDQLEFFDLIITYTDYARDEVGRHSPKMKEYVGVIPHGCNVNDFFPMDPEPKKKFRDQYFGKNAKKFIVGCINRNQPRKDIPTAIFSFIELKKLWDKNEKQQPFLYLHMAPNDPLGHNLPALLEQTDLVEGRDYMFPPAGDENSQVDIATLNMIYNSIDVYLTTTLGEGWGLTTTEAMACKVPCIVPAHTSYMEITDNGMRASLLEEFIPISQSTDSMMRKMCHYEEVAEKLLGMHQLINDKGELRKQLDKTLQEAHDYVWDIQWEEIGNLWAWHFEKLFKVDSNRSEPVHHID